MKLQTKKIIFSLLLTLIIGFGAVAPVFAQTALTEQTVVEARTSLNGLYEDINPSVVYIAVAVPADKSSTYHQRMEKIPWDNFEELFTFFKQFNVPEEQDQDQQKPETESTPNMTYGSGTGFIWDSEGHIVTNNHVIENATEITITYYDGLQRKATIVGADPDSDLAVLSVENYKKDLKPLTIGDSNQVKVGDFVAAIGNPFGNTGTITSGIVSALGRSFALGRDMNTGGSYTIPDMIQTDAAINPGNSGGVLINLNGDVIGVVNSFASSTHSSAGIGYAIPSNLAKRVIPKLISDGKYQHPWIGISGIALTPEINELLEADHDQRGALVQAVQPSSPAEKAGLQGGKEITDLLGSKISVDGDIITRIGDRDVKGMDDIIAYLASNTSVGDKITLQLIRDGKVMKQELTLTARPSYEERTAAANSETQTQQQIGEAWIGAYVKDISAKDVKSLKLPEGTVGALISQVTKDSPADDAKLQENDIIQKFNDVELKDVSSLKTELGKFTPGERVTLTIFRDGKTIEVRLTLGTQNQMIFLCLQILKRTGSLTPSKF